MRRQPRRSNDAQPTGAPAWMVTYGNLMTLVLAFFVLLYALSGHSGAALSKVPDARTGVTTENKEASLQSIQNRLEKALADTKAQQLVRIERIDRSLVIRFDANTLFESGQVEVKERAFPALDAVGQALEGVTNLIRIEGHSDSDPMAPNPYIPDNWVLSGARATSVLRYLSTFHEIDERRLSFAGYADTRPVASNDTPAGKAKNRRVEIVVAGK